MQVISTDKTVRSNTGQDIKDFNTQSLATQVRKGEQLVSVMSANKKVFDLTGDDIVELSTENKCLKEIGCCVAKWLEEYKAKLLQHINDNERANFNMSRMRN